MAELAVVVRHPCIEAVRLDLQLLPRPAGVPSEYIAFFKLFCPEGALPDPLPCPVPDWEGVFHSAEGDCAPLGCSSILSLFQSGSVWGVEEFVPFLFRFLSLSWLGAGC